MSVAETEAAVANLFVARLGLSQETTNQIVSEMPINLCHKLLAECQYDEKSTSEVNDELQESADATTSPEADDHSNFGTY